MSMIHDALNRALQQKKETTQGPSAVEVVSSNKQIITVSKSSHARSVFNAVLIVLLAAMAAALFAAVQKERKDRLQAEAALIKTLSDVKALRSDLSDTIEEKTREEGEFAGQKADLTAKSRQLSEKVDSLNKDVLLLEMENRTSKKSIADLSSRLIFAETQANRLMNRVKELETQGTPAAAAEAPAALKQ